MAKAYLYERVTGNYPLNPMCLQADNVLMIDLDFTTDYQLYKNAIQARKEKLKPKK